MTRRLGPYELISPLGKGGMAQVWMGRRTAMGGASKTVAIKLLGEKVADNPEFRRMFMAEARLSMLLTNSNIVQVFDVGEAEGEAYMVMEWVDGLNLAQLCKRMQQAGERLSPAISVYVVAELLRALSYAHNLMHEGTLTEVVHRDISPQNVMLSVSGEVKLMDFGIARMSTEDTSGVHVKGKLRYMPPEQLRGNARRATVDLFAVGAVLHELLDWRRFRSQVVDEARLYGMILDGEVPPLELPEGFTLPSELEILRSGLLRPNYEQRTATAKEALRQLYKWQGYRNCALDLEELVQRFVGTAAPRTSVSAPVVATSASGSHPGGPHAPASTPAPAVTATEVLPEDQAAASHTHDTVREFAPSTVTTRSMKPRSSGRRSTATTALASGLVVFALGIGVIGTGFGLGWWGPLAERSKPEAEAEVSAAQQLASTQSPSPAAEPEPEPEPELAPTGEAPAPEPAAEPAPEPDAAVAAKPKTKAKAAPVPVELVANDYYYVEAKIAGKIYKLSPIKQVKIRPGSHSLQLRQRDSDPWKSAGKLRIGEGKSWRVEMLDPPGARVSEK